MEKSKVELLNLEDLNIDEKPKKVIMSKPYVAIYTCLIVSLVMIITNKVAVLGWLILPFALFVLFKIPNHKQLELYEKFLLVFPDNKENKIKKINYEDIIDWSVSNSKTSGDNIILHVKENEYVHINSFQALKFFKFFNGVMPEKELNFKRNSEMKNTPFKWPWK